MSDVTTGRTPAYSITEVLEILDPAGAQRYAELTPSVVEKLGGRFVVLGAAPTVAEGGAGTVLFALSAARPERRPLSGGRNRHDALAGRRPAGAVEALTAPATVGTRSWRGRGNSQPDRGGSRIEQDPETVKAHFHDHAEDLPVPSGRPGRRRSRSRGGGSRRVC
jgi:hypothetical protein